MAEPFSVKIEGKIIDKFDRAGAVGRQESQSALKDASGFVWQKTIENSPKSQGLLAGSIRRELTEHYAKIGTSFEYGPYLHGNPESGATHGQPHWIPAREAAAGGTLYRWAMKKGMNPWAVRAAIAKRGVKFNPFLTRTLDETQEDVFGYFEKALDRIANYLDD